MKPDQTHPSPALSISPGPLGSVGAGQSMLPLGQQSPTFLAPWTGNRGRRWFYVLTHDLRGPVPNKLQTGFGLWTGGWGSQLYTISLCYCHN